MIDTEKSSRNLPMTMLSIFQHLKRDDYCFSVDLFNVTPNRANNTVTQKNGPTHIDKPSSGSPSKTKNKGPKLSVIIDSESCLDRLYGGYYSDWASGGQWNRMLGYIGNLYRACQTNNIQLTVAIRGGVEKEHATHLFNANRDFKERLSRVILHLQNRGTPPPKVWWLPPTCLREVLCLAMHYYGIPVLSTVGDYYAEVMSHLNANNMDGLLTDDPNFVLLNPPGLFAAHDFKLTYKGSLETKEYLLEKWTQNHQISPDSFPLLGSLLGNHIITPEQLKEFHLEIVGNTEECKTAEEIEYRTVTAAVNFVKSCADVDDLDTVAQSVFKNSCCSVEEGISKLRTSVDFYKSLSSNKNKPSPPSVVRTTLNVQPVKCERKYRKKDAVVDEDFEPDDSLESSEKDSSDVEASKEKSEKITDGKSQKVEKTGELEQQVNKLTLNGDIKENGVEPIPKLEIEIGPSEAVLKLAMDRHCKGLMSPLIIQSLIQREVRLPCYLENTPTTGDHQSFVEIYRPIRQSIYAILHNLNKHLYDTRKQAEDQGNTIFADDIKISVVEHYLGPLGAEVDHDITVKPVPWPVPSVESLWLGVKPENKLRRIKAFMSCMNVGPNPFMSNTAHVPERFLLICSVLRYLLKQDTAELTVNEVDAVLATATSQVLFDVQTMQDMQLPLITPRGAHVASLVMAGLQHAMLVNDVCGAPVRRQMSFPWLCFDGKLLQYKLLKASSAPQGQRLDLCDGQMAQVIVMERLGQAVWHGLEDKLGDKANLQYNVSSALPGGRMFATPTAYLRPNISSHGRGKGSLMGEFMPYNSKLDARGGKLQVAGQVVATWGPRPGSAHHGPVPNDYHSAAAFDVEMYDMSSKVSADIQQVRENMNECSLDKLMGDIAHTCRRYKSDDSPSSTVNFGEVHDKIFAKLWAHNAGHGEGTAVSCIIVSYKIENKMTEDILILVKGDVPVVTNYSRSGDSFSWRISRMKLWSDSLNELIDSKLSFTKVRWYQQYLQHKVFILGGCLPLEADAFSPIIPKFVQNSIEYNSGGMILRIALPLNGDSASATFLLFVDSNVVDSISGLFKEIETESSCSDGSDDSIFIDELDQEEDISAVTIIQISAKTESSVTEYLYYIVAANLPNLCENESMTSQLLTMRVHYINNNLLHQKITEKFESEESLQGIPEDKREKIKLTGPPFIVTSALPLVTDEGRECEIRQIISSSAIEDLPNGKQKYIYRLGKNLVFQLHEPQSPMNFEFCGKIYTIEPCEPSQISSEKLDEVHLELFNSLRRNHNERGTIHQNHALTAFAVVIHDETSLPSKHVYFAPGLIYGKDVYDMKTRAPLGWRVSTVHIYNERLRDMVEKRWHNNHRTNNYSVLPHVVFQGTDPSRISDEDLFVPGVQEKVRIEGEMEESRRYLKLSCPVVSSCEGQFYEALDSEVTENDVTMLQRDFEEDHLRLFEAQPYLDALTQGGMTQDNAQTTGDSKEKIESEDDEGSVMINVHLLKSKLRARRRRRMQVLDIRDRDELECDIVIFVAIGNNEDLHIPKGFRYHDPLNAWYSRTQFVTSKPLRNAIKHLWERSPATEDSVAQHVVFVCGDDQQKTIQVLGTFKEKVKRELLEIMAHGPKDDALCHALGKNARNKSDENANAFPEDGNLPNSFMYAVAKLKHMILPRPNQLGASSNDGWGELFLLFHDAAHNKFAAPKSKARKLKDHHLSPESGSCDIMCPICKKYGIKVKEGMPR